MKIAVMGAGAIGGYVGGRLAEAGVDVTFIARGAHLDAIRREGLRIESPFGNAHLPDARATDDPAEVGPVDVILFTVKLGDTAAAAAQLVPMVTPETRVVTLQNGIDSVSMLARQVLRDQIAAGTVFIGCRIDRPGVIANSGGVHRMTIDAMGGDRTMAAFFAAVDRAVGIEAVPTDKPERVVWEKFIALVAFSGATCLTRRPIGAVYAHPDIMAFYRQLLTENIALANASGQDFAPQEADRIVELFRAQPYEQKSSMLIDLEAGKPLELPWLSGRAHALGLELGIPTPANTAVWVALCTYADGL